MTSCTSITVVCPYCAHAAVLVDSKIVYKTRSYGMIWYCAPCQAWVGVHRDSPKFYPLGRLANAELRQWKQRAHAAFDVMWRREGGKCRHRNAAYAWLAEQMGMTIKACHIGKFDVADCQRVVEIMKGWSDDHSTLPKT